MYTFLKENKIFKNKFIVVLLLLLYILLLLPFVGNIAYDAVVHFAFAENFAAGYPFQYNIVSTERVIASTSPFWTILLTFFYLISGHFTPLIVKSVCILLWLSCGYLLNLVSRDIWKLKDLARYGVVLMWFANVSIVKNSLGGLENVLSAFQLLFLYYFLWGHFNTEQRKVDYIIGVLLGWSMLTRLDAGLLAAVMVAIFITAKYFSGESKWKKSAASLFVIIIVCIVALLPWYLYQHFYTSKFLSDSSVARIYTGRRNSLVLFNGLFYFHPKALVILCTALIPLSLGFFVTLLDVFKIKGSMLKQNFHILTAVIIVIFTVLAYSLIVGADQFGRYFLISISFFLVAGFYGLQKIHSYLKQRNSGILKTLIALMIIFLFFTNAYDYYKRVVNIEQLESNIYEVFYAPSNRRQVTNYAFDKLGIDSNKTVKLAITEVQYRYFVDNRFEIISLDGRSSPKILKYINDNGFPDFERFIDDEKPDVVEVKGWSSYSDMPEPLSGIFKSETRINLLSSWEERLKEMKIGESFRWRNNMVIYVFPGHVKIVYNYYKKP